MEKSDQASHVDESLLKRRHHLPHWQLGGSTYFVTFRSARGVLPPEALNIARDVILEGDGLHYDLAFGVIMPDHVYLMFRPRRIEGQTWHDLSAILKRIKGVGARRINQALGTSGTVWQKESFDRIVRDDGEFRKNWRYMHENPLRAGLVDDPDDYGVFALPREQNWAPDPLASGSHS